MIKDIGTGSKPPEGKCEDKHCPWHGGLKVRGMGFIGTVKSAKAHNTVIVEWKFHKKVQKFERYERKHSRVAAHNPPCIHAKEGDSVYIVECRPLSKTKKFVVVEKLGTGEIKVRGEDLAVKKDSKKNKKEATHESNHQ